jgi:hypothetical protein
LNHPGYIDHSGVIVTGVRNQPGFNISVVFDGNGENPPNKKGEDQLELILCNSTCGQMANKYKKPSVQAQLGPVITDSASSQLYDAVFQ